MPSASGSSSPKCSWTAGQIITANGRYRICAPCVITCNRVLLLVIARIYSTYTSSKVHTHTNPGRQVTMAIAFCTVTPNICGSSV